MSFSAVWVAIVNSNKKIRTRWKLKQLKHESTKMRVKILRLCYNHVKRKRMQILLALFFFLSFTICFYIAIQEPRKSFIFIDDVNRFSRGLTTTTFFEPTQGKDLPTARSYQQGIFIKEKETFSDAIKNISSSTGLLTHGKSDLVAINSNYSSSEPPPFREENQPSLDEDTTFSLRGFLNLHIWDNVCHFQVESLREFILFPHAPSKRMLLTSASSYGENLKNLGERMFGFISPSASGEYYFAISSSGNSELWLSSDDSSANLRKIAFLGSRENPGQGQPRNYSKNATQVSTAFSLTKNMKYLINVLHKHQYGKLHLEVTWKLAGEAAFVVVTSEYLRAAMNDSHVPDNTVGLADYKEEPEESRDSIIPFVVLDDMEGALPECLYEPSYLVQHKLIRFQGARNKSNTHFASVYPPDTTNDSFALMKSEDIWWQENAAGNLLTNPNMAQGVVRMFMDALEVKYPQHYALQEVVSVEHVPDPQKGDRFLLELHLTERRTGGSVLFSEYVYKPLEEDSLCYPAGFRWNKNAIVNIIVPVRKSGRWALYFIKNIAEVIRQTQDFKIHVIIVDYESEDIDIQAVLNRSSIRWYSLVKISRDQDFQRALALQRGAEAVKDPHSILFMCDLHLKIPSHLISSIRKHCVEGKMTFAPVVKRLRCGYHPELPFGYWETLGFGLLALYKSDFDHAGGMNIREFTGWGGEDWELLDRVLMSGIEVERLKIPHFYHFYHTSVGGNQRVGA